jgi:hypothetical protein
VTGVSYLQVSTVEGISLPGTPTLSIAVSDTGGDLTSSALAALGGDPKVTSITVTTGAISLTEAQFAADTAGLAKLTGTYTIDVTGVTVADIPTVEGISLPGTPTLSIAVSDTGTAISGALATLGSDNDITSISVSSGNLSLAEAAFTADTAGLAKMTGSYTVDVTGVTVGKVATVEAVTGLGGTPTLSIAVSDGGSVNLRRLVEPRQRLRRDVDYGFERQSLAHGSGLYGRHGRPRQDGRFLHCQCDGGHRHGNPDS